MNPEVGADLQVAGRRRDVDHTWRDQLAIRRVLDLQRRAPGEDGRKRTHVVWIEVLHDHHGQRKRARQPREERRQGRQPSGGRRDSDEVKHCSSYTLPHRQRTARASRRLSRSFRSPRRRVVEPGPAPFTTPNRVEETPSSAPARHSEPRRPRGDRSGSKKTVKVVFGGQGE
jgi:hypothetical protein